jgi:RNA polymerase sigma-70 factor (ECF subfamily)
MDKPSSKAGQGRELVPLLHAVAAGDASALASLYELTSGKLYGVCARLLGNNGEAEEVLQDVFVTVWQKASRYDEAKAGPITWLAVMARNKAIDRLRVRRVSTEQIESARDVPDGEALAYELIEQEEEKRRLNGCLDELEDKQRNFIRAAFLDGATYPELASSAAVPLATMKSWIRRGLLRLRGCLEQ